MASVPMQTEVMVPAVKANSLQGLERLAPWRQVALLVVLAATIAVGVASALWLQTPSYVALGEEFPPASIRGVSEVFEREGIRHRIERSGTVLIDAEQLQYAKIILAEAGLSGGGALTAKELYGDDAGFGTTNEQKYQKTILAKQLDLARTISRMKPIVSAKVHLAVVRPSPFQRKQARSSAAVMLELRPGRRLTPTQAGSIQSLVAQAVEGLDVNEVVVTDQSGNALGKNGEDAHAYAMDYTQNYEGRMLRKIGNILTPIAGPRGYTAELTARHDFSSHEAVSKTYDADNPVARSRTLVEAINQGQAGGVPGAVANQPGADANAPEAVADGQGAQRGGTSGNSRKTETVNNEIGVTQEIRRAVSPLLTHLSVVVILDHHRIIGEDGTVARRPWTPEEIANVREQIRSAIGYSIDRQDVVTVANTPFAEAQVLEPFPEPPLWQQPWVWSLAKQISVGLFVLIMIFGVFKPIMRNLVNREIAEREAQTQLEQARLALEAEEINAGRTQDEFASLSFDKAGNFERNIELVRELIDTDPKRAANVVKEWVGEGG